MIAGDFPGPFAAGFPLSSQVPLAAQFELAVALALFGIPPPLLGGPVPRRAGHGGVLVVEHAVAGVDGSAPRAWTRRLLVLVVELSEPGHPAMLAQPRAGVQYPRRSGLLRAGRSTAMRFPAATIDHVTDGALSPLDGRYAPQMEDFARAFSEAALFRQRFAVEVEWLLALSVEPGVRELPEIEPGAAATLRGWVDQFGPEDVARIKDIERRINHDVKAVEYLLKEKLATIGFGPGAEFVHFACTSEDLNNIAQALMLRQGLSSAWLPLADALVDEVWVQAEAYAEMPMPSHTHGQPASPTTLGKELAVFAHRWQRQLEGIRSVPLLAKFNGAVGTYGAHTAAYPDVDWIDLSRRFVEGFGLAWNPLTTQIESHDALAEVFHGVIRFNAILIDFCRDVWEYISRSYLRQRPVAGEVGSSTMPHKVNPIDFENAEANAGVSSALLEHLASKLMISRMQRDLSDSSAIRNMGVALGHSGLALASARRGLAKISPAPEVMQAELDGQWEVLGEAIQTVMRRYGQADPYERLKDLTRGHAISSEDVRRFVLSLGLPEEAQTRLLDLTPSSYVGLAAALVAVGRKEGPGSGR